MDESPEGEYGRENVGNSADEGELSVNPRREIGEVVDVIAETFQAGSKVAVGGDS